MTAAAAPSGGPFGRDLLALTKPRIISLLLVTTVAPMYVAGQPSLLLILIVVIGGYLMAGGANAVNMYYDRDIDDTMARTKLRPIRRDVYSVPPAPVIQAFNSFVKCGAITCNSCPNIFGLPATMCPFFR